MSINCIYQVYFDLKEPFLLTTKRLLSFSFILRKMLHKYILISKNSNANVHLTRFTFKSNSIGFYITYCTQRFITVDWNTKVAPKCWPLQHHPLFYILYLVLALCIHSVDIHSQVVLICVCFVKMITGFRFGIRSVSCETPRNTTLVLSIYGRFPIDCWSLVSMTT